MTITRCFWICPILAATLPSFAQGGKCTVQNISIQATFLATSAPANAIANDTPSQPYVDGTDGVTAVIHRCNGTNDATINLQNARRKLAFQFPTPEAGSLYPGVAPPSFAGGTAFSTAAFINV